MIDVKRSEVAPASLAEKKSYKSLDVLKALHRDFLGKCYLCETPVELGTFEVDHQRPRTDFAALEFAWTNLFPTCNTHRCNQRRPKPKPPAPLLDPSNGDNVERRVHQRIPEPISRVLREDAERCRFSFTAASSGDVPAENTASELDHIHNGTGSRVETQETAITLREKIRSHVFIVAEAAREFDLLPFNETERRESLKNDLRKYFSRRAPYTMLVRSYFKHRPELRELFD